MSDISKNGNKNNKELEQEEARTYLIDLINRRAEELGRCPRKSDMDLDEVNMIHKYFGKWCYALEASGQRVPSETTLARRRNKKLKWRRKHVKK